MTRHTVTYELGDVVVVPFPFTDRLSTKRRPALVVSSDSAFNTPSGHIVLAMITSEKSAPWPLDVVVDNLDSAGLPAPSKIRMKIFTLDQRLIIRKAGRLTGADLVNVSDAITTLLRAGTGAGN